MTKVLLSLLLVLSFSIPVNAMEITAPEVPKMYIDRMPQNTSSFTDGILELTEYIMESLVPELRNAVRASYKVIVLELLFSLLSLLSEKIRTISSIASATAIAVVIFQNTNAMIGYAVDTVLLICEYGKQLCPAMTMALAAQGGVTASAALYTGTMLFITLLCMLISKVLVPMIYLFLVFSVSNCALGDETMKHFSDTLKSGMIWLLKTILILFTTYMSITGTVSGSTDTAALKAAKVTISSTVPVVGGILSDASETVLVGVGMMKNAAGIYGILAVLAFFVGPFVKVGAQYLILKISAGICGMFGNKNIAMLIDDFSIAMGLLVAIVASGCVLVLVSTICFMKGIG